MSEKICIELHTDNNYVIPAIVTITSILKNKKKASDYEIIVLGNNLTSKNINLLQKTGVKFIPHNSSFDKFEGKHDFVSSTDLFKFDLPNVLKDWDKVLYIDTDMIIQDDLSELFNTDLSDNYVAAVKDMTGMVNEDHHNRLNLQNYFNAGLMLLNLKKMREDNISEKLYYYKFNEDCGHFMSQDALNKIFNEKVIWLNPKYNYMGPNLQQFSDEGISKFYNLSLEEYIQIKEKPVIVHLTNKNKPWNYKKTWGKKLWMKYFKKSICKHQKLKYKDNNIDFKTFIRIIFSVTNEYKSNKKIKCISLLGIKIKFSKELK